MCFAIPLKVKRVKNNQAEMEDGRVVKLGELTKIKQGDYLEVYADIAVQKLPDGEAKSIRRLIKKSQ